jgi:hypothetical protein
VGRAPLLLLQLLLLRLGLLLLNEDRHHSSGDRRRSLPRARPGVQGRADAPEPAARRSV